MHEVVITETERQVARAEKEIQFFIVTCEVYLKVTYAAFHVISY